MPCHAIDLFLFLFVRDLKVKHSVATQQVEIDSLLKELWLTGNSFLLELELALSALVVLGSNVVVVQRETQNHVVQGWNVEGKRFVPNGVAFVALGGRDLDTIVLVADLSNDMK